MPEDTSLLVTIDLSNGDVVTVPNTITSDPAKLTRLLAIFRSGIEIYQKRLDTLKAKELI